MTHETREPTDGEILAAVLDGDRDRYAVIVSRYRRALHRLAVGYLGETQAAEDAVQEAFLNSFRWLHTYDSRYSFRTWLWRILLNVCYRSREKARKYPLPSSTLASQEELPVTERLEGELGGESIGNLIRDERNEALREMLQRISPLQAEAIRLRFFGEMKFQEIADAQEISLPAAKARVRNGLLQLAKLIKNTNQELSEEYVG